jgi:hypothetical protein
MRVLLSVLVTIFSCAVSAQEHSFSKFSDSLARETGCPTTYRDYSERHIPGFLHTIVAQNFLNTDLTLGLAANSNQNPDRVYTKTYEDFGAPQPYTAMATVFPEEKLGTGHVRKLVSFVDFEKGQGPYEMSLYGFRSHNAQTEMLVFWKKLPHGLCMVQRFEWMASPALVLTETGMRIELHKAQIIKGAISVELIDAVGRTVLVQHVANPERGIEINFDRLKPGAYLLLIKDADKTVFARYLPESSL